MIKMESRVFNFLVLLIFHQIFAWMAMLNRTSATPIIKFEIYFNLALLVAIIYIIINIVLRVIQFRRDDLLIKVSHSIGLSVVMFFQFFLGIGFVYIAYKWANFTLALTSILIVVLCLKNIVVLLTYNGVSNSNIYYKGTKIKLKDIDSFERGENDIYITLSRRFICFNICDVICLNIKGENQDTFGAISSRYSIIENHNMLCKTL